MTCSTWHPPRSLTGFRRGLYTDEAGWLAGANGGYLGFKFIAWRSSRFPCLPGAAISLSGPYGQIDHRNNHEDECQQLRPSNHGNLCRHDPARVRGSLRQPGNPPRALAEGRVANATRYGDNREVFFESCYNAGEGDCRGYGDRSTN